MSDYEARQRKRNIVVGTFVLVALCAVFGLIYKFGDLPVKIGRMKSFEIVVQFPTARGIQANTPVNFCGYQVGLVSGIMSPEKVMDLNTKKHYHQTKVRMLIERRYANIPSNVEIKVMTRGLGSSYIEMQVDPDKELVPCDPNCPESVFLMQGMVIQGTAGMTSEFFPAESQKKLDNIANSIGILITNLNDILGDKENKDNIKATLGNLTETTREATEAMKQIRRFAATGIDLSDELNKSIVELRQIFDKINGGEGTVGKLINDGRLYEDIRDSVQQVNLLVEEIHELVEKEKAIPIKLK